MAKNKTKYDELKSSIATGVTDKGSRKSFSKSDLKSVMTTLLNTPDQTVEVFSKKSDDTAPIITETKPVQRYRTALKNVVKKNFGIDSEELDKLDVVEFTGEHAEALCDVAAIGIKDYVLTGRKMVFPITDSEETSMSLIKVDVPEKVSEGRRFVTDEDGKTSSIPNGKYTTTKRHDAMKDSNNVPPWLKSAK